MLDADPVRRSHRSLLISWTLFILSLTPVFAQIPSAGVRSPEVSRDRRVTFRFQAPNAKQVTLALEGSRPAPMTRDEKGVWSVTTEPLEPDYYTYSFYVDGVNHSDPSNPLAIPRVAGGFENLVHVRGDTALLWERDQAPAGTLHRHLYFSKTAGEHREFLVYTPPGYDPSARRSYPVLFLLHGVTEDHHAWIIAGRADAILDNLIAQRKAKPMLVVFPLGYGFNNPAERVFDLFRIGADQKKMMGDFAITVLDEILPLVEKEYRASKSRADRAIAGLSMGGAQATYIGLNHPDRFGWIGAFSSAYVMYGADRGRFFPKIDGASRPEPRLLWIACGREDFLYGANRQFREWLKTKGVAFTPVDTPGAHTWRVWRRNLTEFLPLLFR
jgi:enterochelin esterase family protein